MPDTTLRSNLKRLPAQHYTGFGFVHWNMTIDKRKTGWLNPLHHAHLREALLHSLVRYHLACPIYTLMPDHGHFLLMGYASSSDQLRAVSYFRRQWNELLKPAYALQHQAYDNVLSETERERDAFQTVAHYIAENPVRAGHSTRASTYRYSGSLFPGYPKMDFRRPNFWESFWTTYNQQIENSE